ncbi:MAG: beta-hexosaminidase [Rhodobacterales bacterium]|nr:beta-hexosaminidase [Rhodobacterales bacterium]
MAGRAVIFGAEGQSVTDWEKGFFREVDPWGFILFARNVENPEQLRRLTSELRETVGWQAPVLIDQEGGRVQRMRAPHWREYLPALDQMRRANNPIRAQWVRNRLIAAELRDVGIDVNCAPLADIAEAGTHPVLLNRLYGYDHETVADAAWACAEGLMAGGVLPVVKHLPGYGQGKVDSHLTLPVNGRSIQELNAHDFRPFRALCDLPLGMTAHIVMASIDPDQPATTSHAVMEVIRRPQSIGFQGLIMTDDLNMQALSGTLAQRAAASIAAGCDLVLQCNGKPSDMEMVAGAVGALSSAARTRADAALARRDGMGITVEDLKALEVELNELIGSA